MAVETLPAPAMPKSLALLARLSPTALFCLLLLIVFVLIAIFAPALVMDPQSIDPVNRLKLPGTAGHPFGTDHLGRDVFARVMYGTRPSLVTGFSVAVIASVIGLAFGVMSGYFRTLDRVMMPVVDGMMAIPGILLAVALVALLGGGRATVITAIAIPEIPRMIRLTRSVTLSVRQQAFVSAAVSIGTPTPLILLRHIVPNTVATVTVQATYVCASAIITEAVLSFLGIGGSALPSWGSMIAEARTYIQIAPYLIAFPGVFLSLLVLSVNVLGDQFRDILDPRVARRIAA